MLRLLITPKSKSKDCKNFDKTITTVPTQALIGDAFKNWRGMQETQAVDVSNALFILI